MNNPKPVSEIDRREDLPEERECCRWFEFAFATQSFVQIFALDELHHEIKAVIATNKTKEPGDMLVIQ